MNNYKGINGAPWHVERAHRQEGDIRRHRSRCLYYDTYDKKCSQYLSSCIGAAHCKKYIQRERVQGDYTPPIKTAKTIDYNKITIEKQNVPQQNEAVKINVKDTINHKIFGKGKVISIEGSVATVQFASGVKKFPLTQLSNPKFIIPILK